MIHVCIFTFCECGVVVSVTIITRSSNFGYNLSDLKQSLSYVNSYKTTDFQYDILNVEVHISLKKCYYSRQSKTQVKLVFPRLLSLDIGLPFETPQNFRGFIADIQLVLFIPDSRSPRLCTSGICPITILAL